MAEDAKEESGFKVVDRRPFAADGSRREDSREEEASKREVSPVPRVPSPTKSRAPFEDAGSGYDLHKADMVPSAADEEPGEYGPEDESGFSSLVSYLYTTAMFQLGLMQGPGGERIPPDLTNARRTVDLLEVLKDKTRGNLTAVESKLLDDVLYDLRVTFVDVQKQLASKKR